MYISQLLKVSLVLGFVISTAAVIQLNVPQRISNNINHFDENPYFQFNEWINSFIYSQDTKNIFNNKLGIKGGHYILTYLRDLFAGTIMYYLTSGLWHIYIYKIKGDELFGDEFIKPSTETIKDQIMLAQSSLFIYAALPCLSDFLIAEGYTKCYYYLSEIGGIKEYICYTICYFALVEIGIYWMHRTLHTNKFLYKYIHALHHKYNKPETLSPWASIAFNPLDGILQACPYVICLFIIPCHYLTHVVMLFFTAIWATNIHDALDGDTEPIMGSKYHTMHHTHYHVNFGQIFIFADKMFGTLRVPLPRGTVVNRKSKGKTS